MNDIVMIFAQGFVFVGRSSAIENNVLKDAVRLDTVNTISSIGELKPITVLRQIGDVKIKLHDYPHSIVTDNGDLFRDYVRLTSGIEMPAGKLSH